MDHICKHCNQSFASGKSLGGHMRAHLSIMNPVTKRQEIDEIEEGFGCNGESDCGFAESSKKSCRVFDHKRRVLEQQSVCEQCGRGFKSDKALFGHMRLHSFSRKGKVKEDFKVQSDYIILNPVRKKRSQRRYELNTNSSSSNLNESSCVSNDDDDDELELKELAWCLLSLSKGGFYSASVESCEIDSVHLEPKLAVESSVDSLHLQLKLGIMNTQMDYYDGTDVGCSEVRFKRGNSDYLKSRNVLFGKNVAEFCDSDNGLMSTDLNKVDFDDGLKDGEFKKSNLGKQLDLELYDSEILDQSTIAETTIPFDLKKADLMLGNLGFNENNNAEACVSVSVTEEALLSSHCTDVAMDDHTENNPEIRCKICSKVFQSIRALRGHGLHCPVSRRRSLKKPAPGAAAETRESNDNDTAENKSSMVGGEVTEKDEASNKLRQCKNFVCSICNKAFQSGQALGGHMRAHFGSSDNEANDHVEPKACWYGVGSENESPAMVGLVTH